MKKIKLLLAAMAAMVSSGVHAQTWTGNEVAEGTFYLYNVGAEKFLNNGDPNENWGTNAYLQAGFGLDVKLESTNDANAYNLNTNVSNGNNNNYLATSTWCDGGATAWTFTAVDGETNTYTISSGDSYLVANDALNDVVYGASTGDAKSYWKLVSEDDFKDAMLAKTYSAEDPMDVSVFIKGRSFARNDGRNSTWVRTYQNADNQKWIEGGNGSAAAAAGKYYGNEFWNQTFDIHQEITGLPDGTYEVQCSGFGTNGTTFIYGNRKEGALTTENSAANGSRFVAAKEIADNNAWAGQTTGTFTLSGGNLTVGLKRTTNKSYDWCVYDEFRLYYYGLDLSEFAATLADAVAAAEAVVYGTIPTAAYYALAAVVTENNKTYTSAADYTAAANAIVEATNTAKALQANYSRYNSVKTAILAINSEIDLSAANTQADEATTNEAIDAAVVTARAALGSYFAGATIEDQEIDLTAALIDNAAPGTAGNMNYWTNSGNPGLQYNLYEYYDVAGATSKQTIATQLPVGYYKMTVIGYTREGFDGFINAGDNKQTLVGVASGTVNNRNQGNTWIGQGNGVNEMIFQLTDATSNLEIGITAGQTGDRWTVWRSFKLEYLGTAPLSLFQDRLAAAATAAESHATELNGTIPSAASTAYSDAINTAKAANTTTTECLQSISDIEAATASADALVTPYAMYKSMAEAATTEGVASDVISAQDTAVEGATTIAAIQVCAGVLQRARVVLAIGENENVDLTSFVDNLDFEQGNLRSWTSANGGNVANNNNFGLKQGTWYAERWQSGVALGAGSLTHDDIYLPAGYYKVTADAQNIEQYNSSAAGTGLFLCANSDQTEIGAAANYEVYVKLNSDDVLSIKFLQDNCTGNWISYDNITLTYVAADFPAYALVEGKMNGTVAAAQTEANATFDEAATGTNYVALTNAIAAAQASKDAYTAAAAALTKANSILNSTNVYTAEARTAYADAIAVAQTAYDEASMEDATANGLNAALNVAAWGATQPTGAAYIGSAWSGEGINYNFWSREGDGEGASGMSTPFVQAWVADAEKLADNTISATLSDLENGLYSVTAFVRVFNNKEGDDEGYDGISLAVNDGTPVAFAEATQYTDGYAKEITAEGLVKDGNLVIKVAVEGTNASWLAFKNVNYTKVRDLTDEEMAVVPTGIALYNGEDEVTEAIALDESNLTVTLTPSYTPAYASEGYINWTSSDESVATVSSLGEVTAVLPGTATITATSTLDNTVSASATVTVTFPESEVPETYYVNDGAKRTVYTLGKNLFENGTFAYPNAVAGWKTVGYTTDALVTNVTVHKAGGVNDGAFIETAGGGVGSEKTLRKSIAVEVGKTYYFSVYTSGKAPSNKQNAYNWQYNALFKMSDATTENGTIKVFEWPQGAEQTTSEWSKTECVFTAETPFVGVRMGWNSQTYFDEFVLAEVTKTEEVGNVDYATAAIPTANIGTGVFQYSQDAIDAAEALVQGTATVEDVEAAYEALTTLNAPDEDKIYNIVVATDGHAKNGNAVVIVPGSTSTSNPTGYGLNANFAINANLNQGVTFTKVSGNTYNISFKTAEGETYLTYGAKNGSTVTWKNSQIQATTDADNKGEFLIEAVETDNVFNIVNTITNSTIACQNGGNIYTESGNAAFTLAEATKPSITINTTAAGWGTVMLPFAVAELPNGVKAYSVSALKDDQLELDLVEVTDGLEANTPYIIEGSWNETLTGDALGTALQYTPEGSLLTGTYEDIDAPVGSYVLQKQDENVGFFKVEDVQPKVKANRAYLTVSSADEVKAFYLGDTKTAIKSVFDGIANGDIYDLNGRKIQKLQKGGIYIVNGKKVSVK